MKNINFASRPYTYFSEQVNVDDDATFITILLVSFNLQSRCLMQSAVCSLQSAVCSLQMSYTGQNVMECATLLRDIRFGMRFFAEKGRKFFFYS